MSSLGEETFPQVASVAPPGRVEQMPCLAGEEIWQESGACVYRYSLCAEKARYWSRVEIGNDRLEMGCVTKIDDDEADRATAKGWQENCRRVAPADHRRPAWIVSSNKVRRKIVLGLSLDDGGDDDDDEARWGVWWLCGL